MTPKLHVVIPPVTEEKFVLEQTNLDLLIKNPN